MDLPKNTATIDTHKGKFSVDLKEGLHEGFYENGQLKYRANFKNGILVGLREEFYEDGRLRFSGRFQEVDLNADEMSDLKACGIDQGRLYGEYSGAYTDTYFLRGIPIGEHILNDQQGQLAYRGKYKKGIKTGTHEVFFCEVTADAIAYLINQTLNRSRSRDVGQSELISIFTDLYDSVRDKVYDINAPEYGQVMYRAKYKRGEVNGLQEFFYPYHELAVREEYNNGEKEGLSSIFFPNGTNKTLGVYREGKRQGVHEWFYENGDVNRREWYSNGRKDGPHEFFSKSRSLVSRATYYDNGQSVFIEIFIAPIFDLALAFERMSGFGLKSPGLFQAARNFKLDKLNWTGFPEDRPESSEHSGKLLYSANYKRGRLYGMESVFYPNSRIYMRTEYREGSVSGVAERYDQNGDSLPPLKFLEQSG